MPLNGLKLDMTRFVESAHERKEAPSGLAIEWPVSYAMFDGVARGVLSESVVNNPEFQVLSEQRRDLYKQLSDILLKIEDGKFDINKALKLGKITADDISTLYKSLGSFIAGDANNSRLLLYLPFELFPSKNEEIDKAPDLVEDQKDFYCILRAAWEDLLYESDVRASFVDGDVLEPGMGEPVRVRKAAHLIPFLVPAGVLRIEDVNQILKQAIIDNDVELVVSIEEGLSALKNLDLEKESTTTSEAIDILYAKLVSVEKELSENTDYVKKISDKRLAWERKVRRDEILENAARDLSGLLLLKKFDLKEIDDLNISDTDKSKLRLKTLQFSVEQCYIHNEAINGDLLGSLEVLCKKIWQDGGDLLKDEVHCTLSRLNRLGLMIDVGKELGVEIYDLSSTRPVYFENMVRKEYAVLEELVEIIKNDPELSDSLFPFFACVGSKVKGIASINSDKDAVLFWRPGATLEKRISALKKIAEKCPKILEMDSMPEVWLEYVGDKFEFRKGTESYPNNVSPQQIHFIMNGLLVGDKEEIKVVMSDLVEGYLDLRRLGKEKDGARQFLLRRLEMDNLMYRLMHKGFKRSYVQKNNKSLMKEIDYKSDFYEPSYRGIASLIFVSRVLLPDLKLKKAPIEIGAEVMT